jgi:hypothetical protein
LIDEHILKDTHILKLNILGCDNVLIRTDPASPQLSLQPNHRDCLLVLAAAALSAGFVFPDLSVEEPTPIVATNKSAVETTFDVASVELLSSAVVRTAAVEG